MSLKIVYIATDPVSAFRFMEGQLSYLRQRGFELTVITSPGPLLERVKTREGVAVVGISMARQPAPGRDLLSLLRLTAALRRLRPDLVVAGTPKGGLLGVIAARMAGVPRIVYHLRGLRFATTRGVLRGVLWGSEWVAAGLCHRVLCNGESLRQEFVRSGCAPEGKIWFPAHGTSNGVDTARFARTPERVLWAAEERKRLGIADPTCVIGFVGRFTRDKGITELVTALELLSACGQGFHLLAVGDRDSSDPLPDSTLQWLASSPRVTWLGFTEEPARYYSLMDVFAFPSHREGFPNAPLEAAAAGVPTVAFRAVGTVDAVVHEETGILVELGDTAGLAQALLRYAQDAELRRLHGSQALNRVNQRYRREVVWEALGDWYEGIAKELGQPPPKPR